MRTVIKLDVSDEARSALACLMAGKRVKRLASRDDVAAFVLGSMAALHRVAVPGALGPATPEAQREVDCTDAPMSAWERHEAQRLRFEGHPDSYIIGWLKVGRQLGLNK